jgi:hypothetical protein
MSIRAIIITGDRPGAEVRWGGTQVHDIIEADNARKMRRLVLASIHCVEDDVVTIKYEDTERPDLPGKDVTGRFVEIAA